MCRYADVPICQCILDKRAYELRFIKMIYKGMNEIVNSNRERCLPCFLLANRQIGISAHSVPRPPALGPSNCIHNLHVSLQRPISFLEQFDAFKLCISMSGAGWLSSEGYILAKHSVFNKV